MSRHVVNQIISSQVVVDPPFLLDLTDPVTGAYLPLPAVACSVVKLSIHATKCMDVYNASTLETKTFGFIQHPQFGWVLDYPGIQAFCVTTTGAPAVGRVKKWYNQVYEVPRSSGFGTLDPDTQQKHLLGGWTDDVLPTYPYIYRAPGTTGISFHQNQPFIYAGGAVPATGVGGRLYMDATKGGDLFNGKNYHYLQMVNVYGGQGEKYNWKYLFKVRHGSTDIPLSIQGADTNSAAYKPSSRLYLSNYLYGAQVLSSSNNLGSAGSTKCILTSVDAEWNVGSLRNVWLTTDSLTDGVAIQTDTRVITNTLGAPLPTHAQGTLLDIQRVGTYIPGWQHLVIYDDYTIKPYLPLLRDTVKLWFK